MNSSPKLPTHSIGCPTWFLDLSALRAKQGAIPDDVHTSLGAQHADIIVCGEIATPSQ